VTGMGAGAFEKLRCCVRNCPGWSSFAVFAPRFSPREARDERCSGCLPPSRSSRGRVHAEGATSGDYSHCPRRTQVVVKVTLRVVRSGNGGVCRMRHNPDLQPYQVLGDRLASPPGIGPVPLRPLAWLAPAAGKLRPSFRASEAGKGRFGQSEGRIGGRGLPTLPSMCIAIGLGAPR